MSHSISAFDQQKKRKEEMSSSSIRKGIGIVKDQTSMSLAKVEGNIAPELEFLVDKATSHDADPADGKYFREIINLPSSSSSSRGCVRACVPTLSRRLRKTQDWIVALKALVLVHGLLGDGHPWLAEELAFSARRGMRVLNMSDFSAEARSDCWDHAGFVRKTKLNPRLVRGYLTLLMMMKENLMRTESIGMILVMGCLGDRGVLTNLNDRPSGKEQRKEATMAIKEMKTERIFKKLNQLLRILGRVVAGKLAGMARNSRLVLAAFYTVVKESFGMSTKMQEALRVLLERYAEMEYPDCVKGFDIYGSAAKMIDELVDFYGWCKDVGIARSSEFSEVERRELIRCWGRWKGF